jgi:heat shock protein HslJ
VWKGGGVVKPLVPLRRRRLSTAVAVAVAVVVGGFGLAGCGDDPSSTSPGGDTVDAPSDESAELSGSSWILAAYSDGSTSVPAAPGAVTTIEFAADGVLRGSTGCNQFSGTYLRDGDQLALTLGPMTQMACLDQPLQAQENALVALFPRVDGYTMSNEQLMLTDEAGAVVLTYEAGLSGLEGTSWQVVGVNTGSGAVESSALTEELTLVFRTDDEFSGFGGCNDIGGSYDEGDDGSLTFTEVLGTQMSCGAEADALETQYLAALGRVSTYELTGDRLTLRANNGETQVTLSLVG